MPLEIFHGDVTEVHADAIVNAANSDLQESGGICASVFAAAGAKNLQKACDAIGSCEVGMAVITQAYNASASFIIHTVGPVWLGGGHNEKELLASCYRNALKLARKYQLKSIAFPLISAGYHGYPQDEALETAVIEIIRFLRSNKMTVYLVLYSELG